MTLVGPTLPFDWQSHCRGELCPEGGLAELIQRSLQAGEGAGLFETKVQSGVSPLNPNRSLALGLGEEVNEGHCRMWGGVWEAAAQDAHHPGDGGPDARMGSLGAQRAQEALLVTDAGPDPGGE